VVLVLTVACFVSVLRAYGVVPKTPVREPTRIAVIVNAAFAEHVCDRPPAPAVADSQAFGKLYVGPVALATFEENAGKTNSSLVRFEGNAVFGVERQNAAVRIAASSEGLAK
jgi:hypothetical protein